MAFDHDLAGLADVGLKRGVLAHAPHQHAGAAIDEALGEPLVQRVGELVLDRTRDPLPMLGIGEPVQPVGRERPGPDMGDAIGQRIDVAFSVVGEVDLAGEPVDREFPFPHQIAVERHHQLGMRGRRDLAIVGNLADLPQPRDRFRRGRHVAHVVVARGVVEHQDVLGDRCARQSVLLRRLRERSLQSAERKEVERGVAPLQGLDRLERMAFQRVRELGLERRTAAGGAEGAIAACSPGTARDLGELGRIEAAELVAVELAIGCERDVIDVEIEPHADGVGGDQIFDIARLIERDLGVAGARRERAHHHGGAAALAADQLGDGVDLVSRERDDGRAARQARDLLLAREGKLRQARTGEHMRARQEPLHHRPHGGGAEHQRLLAAAAVEHAVGEDMAALEIGAKLHFVDGQERDVELAWHRLHGRDPEARVRRLDLLLAGNQRHRIGTDPLHTPVVDLARQEPQRQSDNAAGMPEHALDGEMGFAGVGGAKHGGDANAAGAGVAIGRG